ncbi:hypothetical protein V0R37_12450 [Pollutimonas sp. H1-120]|uniref:hypothetical protein n=1 Tax=Pollutimonas sp. H1-120 TaxID=3148824 RepID=UPI003B51CB7B
MILRSLELLPLAAEQASSSIPKRAVDEAWLPLNPYGVRIAYRQSTSVSNVPKLLSILAGLTKDQRFVRSCRRRLLLFFDGKGGGMFCLICSLRSRSCVAALAARLFTIKREIAKAIANATTSMMPLAKLITQHSTGATAPQYISYDDFSDSLSIQPCTLQQISALQTHPAQPAGRHSMALERRWGESQT